jgi:broad specificity phosphatase PhoE
MQTRSVSAIRDWNDRLGGEATYVVVSHADVIKAILADALGMHLDQFQRLVVDPASLSVIDYTPLRPFVSRINDRGGSVDGLVPPKKKRRTSKAATSSSDAVVGGGAGPGPAKPRAAR